MQAGVVVDGVGFELLVGGQRVGQRRVLTDADTQLLAGFAGRYGRAVQAVDGDDVFAGIGRDLAGWLDGEAGQLAQLLDQAATPLVFEVQGPRSPSTAGWALLRAPFELLAGPDGALLSADELLGFTVVRRLGAARALPALGAFRLGLAFMASAPRGASELDFEAEEAAILAAVGERSVDLLVEDTGDPQQLARRLAVDAGPDTGGVPVVHLSCHGLNNWSPEPGVVQVAPVLWMEDDNGDARPTTAADLATELTARPRLVFLSACLTATGVDSSDVLPPGRGHKSDAAVGSAGHGRAGGRLVAHSLATALVSAGFPAVLGWDGSVGDSAATLFAQHLYQALANRADLAVAVGDARRVLLRAQNPAVRADWHLARVWLGPAGGGPLVGGSRKRSLVGPSAGTKRFLDIKGKVPVAAAGMFVGRRRDLQDTLRVLRSGNAAGVLLHGQGRLGKSSLAARVADRLPSYVTAVVFGDYTALGILDAVRDAVRTNPAARRLIDARLGAVREDPAALEALLVDLVTGPCAQSGDDGQKPLFLIIDDLEQILLPDPTGAHRVDPAYAAVLAAVLATVDPDETDSRLLVTSRFTFNLNGLEARLVDVPLAELSAVAQRKLQTRQQNLTTSAVLDQRDALAPRVLAVCRGNPGLQDLIGLRIVYNAQVPIEQAEQAVSGMETYLQRGDLPDEPQVREFLENLALDALLEQAGSAGRDLLRAATLFTVPVPHTILDVLAGEVGGSPSRLRGLGLLTAHPNLYHPGNAGNPPGFAISGGYARSAVAVDPLAAGRINPLTADEQQTLAALIVEQLYAAWGGPDHEPHWPARRDLELTRLALLADHPNVTAACAVKAVSALLEGPATEATELGMAAIALLDRHHIPSPLSLLRRTAAAALTSGDGDKGQILLDRAGLQAENDPDSDLRDRARVLGEQARHLRTRGDIEQAERLFTRAHQMFTEAGSEREAATAQGDLADIVYRRGDYDEALRIRREVQLPVYERLGDTRSAAITWGNIADIAYQRGDYDEALRIRREVELPVYERLGDTRSAAVTWGQIADIAYQRGDYDEALRIRREGQLPVYERLGETRESAITWGNIADIAYRRGDYEEALRIRREVQLPVYERLGDTRSAAVTWGKIADIAYQRGDYDEALRIRREVQLPVYKRLGDTRESAITWGNIADIAYQRGDNDEALRIRREVQLPVFERLGDTRSAAVTWGNIADIAYQRGDYDEALRIRREVQLPVFERLGDTRSTAVTWGNIADIAYQRGDNDEALRIRREVQLPVFERLGDTRSTAVTWGNIADIAYRRGDYDEATRLQTRRLEVNRELGDLDGIAAASWDLAQVNLTRDDYEAAVPRLVEAFQIFSQLRRPDGIAVVGYTLGQLLAAAKHPEARDVLDLTLVAADKIGNVSLADRVRGLLNTLDQSEDP